VIPILVSEKVNSSVLFLSNLLRFEKEFLELKLGKEK
jgi:hypothetical protein